MKRAVIDFEGEVIRTALVDDDKLVEIVPTYRDGSPMIGDIYTGIVKRILKSGFAFVDIGEEKNAFLYLTDKKEASLWNGDKLSIKEGNTVTVQVFRDAVGDKGAAVTTALSLGGQRVVVMTGHGEVRVSRKITDDSIRVQLKKLFDEDIFSGYDIIVRTKAGSADPEEVRAEAVSLMERLKDISQKAAYRKAPARVYKTEGQALAAIKAFEGLFEIVVNNINDYYEYIDPDSIFEPVLYEGKIPIFKEYFIESKAEKALSPKVWLKSGGYIVIEPTEAMVVIDVNSGKNNTKTHEDTVFKTNMEAASEIMRQLRLRNLSGTIAVDFINMKDNEYNTQLVELLKKEAEKDRISVTVIGMTVLGLVFMTRKRVGLPLAHHIGRTCPICHGRGYTF